MRLFSFVFLFSSCLLGSQNVYAHPISYEGGLSLMSEMSQKNQEISFVYSPKYWLGAGLLFIKPLETSYLISSQVALLVKRWNLPSAQGNFYFFGGLGYYFLEEKTRLIYRLGIQLDYETRKIYLFMKYAEHRLFENNNEINNKLSTAFGFAPYLAEFDELNSWLIFKVVLSGRLSKIHYIPMLRFFYKNFLWEIGQSFNGDSQFNFMFRF